MYKFYIACFWTFIKVNPWRSFLTIGLVTFSFWTFKSRELVEYKINTIHDFQFNNEYYYISDDNNVYIYDAEQETKNGFLTKYKNSVKQEVLYALFGIYAFVMFIVIMVSFIEYSFDMDEVVKQTMIMFVKPVMYNGKIDYIIFNRFLYTKAKEYHKPNYAIADIKYYLPSSFSNIYKLPKYTNKKIERLKKIKSL